MMQAQFLGRHRPSSIRIHILSGAVGMLAGLQHLLSAKERTKRAPEPEFRESVHPASNKISGANGGITFPCAVRNQNWAMCIGCCRVTVNSSALSSSTRGKKLWTKHAGAQSMTTHDLSCR